MKCPLQYDEIITLPDDLTGEFNPNSVGMQMVWGGLFGNEYSMSSGRAVMIDDAGEHYMLSFEVGKDKDGNPQFSPKKKKRILSRLPRRRISCITVTPTRLLVSVSTPETY